MGPEITAATVAEAEKLARVELTAADRAQVAGNWSKSMAPTMERRTGPRKIALEPTLAPGTLWNPMIPGVPVLPARDRFVRSAPTRRALPTRDEDIAFASVTELSVWIQSRALTSERLTRIYLERMKRFDPKLKCIITPTPEQALARARSADAEIAAGKYRGPLHGIPFGVKDLLDTKGILTTYGAEPYRNRVPDADSAVVDRLYRAGAVLVAKLSLGSLALNDVWFGGQTMNPWLLEEGSGGSSAGPGSATGAALVGFSVGSETGGSIVDPAMRCGVTGLRPTFGKVPRTGAMTLCWSLDKLGPMTRGVEDAFLVLQAISGPDPGDLSSVPSKLDFDANGSVQGQKIGFIKAWMNESPATEVDRAALETARKLGMVPVEVSLPDWPYGSLNTILFAEGGGRLRRADALARVGSAQDAGPRRVAEHLPAVALSLGRRLRSGRSTAQEGGAGDGPDLRDSRHAAGARAARRDPHDHQFHRPPGSRRPCRVRRRRAGAQRLGAGSRASSSDLLDEAERAARDLSDRQAVRRRGDRHGRRGPGAGLRRGGQAAERVLKRVARKKAGKAPRKSRLPAVTWSVARRIALAMPGVAEGTSYRTPAFRIAGKFFFRLREDAESLAVRIDFDTRDALLQANPKAFFITDHYKGYPAMCVHLSTVLRPELKALLEESWRCVAPKRLIEARYGKTP